MSTKHPLVAYSKRKRVTLKRIAEIAGVNRSTLYRAMSGEIDPSLSLLVRIKDATGGAVTPNDFVRRPNHA